MAHIIEIGDFEAPQLDVYARLSENQLLNRQEPEKGMFIAESPKVIERALDAGCIPISFLMERKHVEGEGRELIERCSGLPVYTAPFDVLTKLTGFQLTRGMLCAMYRPPLPTVEQVCEKARRIVVLENVVNPTNVGAIFRSAAALHMDGILLTPACSNPLYRRAIRVSMGTVFQIPWTFLEKDINALKEMGFRTIAMALREDSIGIDDPRLRAEEKLAILLGVSGAPAFYTGVEKCSRIISINSDREAPITRKSDLAICGDCTEIFTRFTELLKEEPHES